MGVLQHPVSYVADLQPIEESSAKFPVNSSKFLVDFFLNLIAQKQCCLHFSLISYLHRFSLISYLQTSRKLYRLLFKTIHEINKIIQ